MSNCTFICHYYYYDLVHDANTMYAPPGFASAYNPKYAYDIVSKPLNTPYPSIPTQINYQGKFPGFENKSNLNDDDQNEVSNPKSSPPLARSQGRDVDLEWQKRKKTKSVRGSF